MARIIYALSGQGRGHASRVMAVSDLLHAAGHEIVFCCGGTAKEVLATRDVPCIQVPPLRQVIKGNEVRLVETLRCNWDSIVHLSEIVSRLAEQFRRFDPDLVITDFEAFSHRAAAQLDVPVISFNHQQIVTETRYRLPVKYWFDATTTSLAIRLIAPSDPEHVLITSFFFPELRNPENTTVIPPIIRPAVQNLDATRGDHVLVYYNNSEGTEHVLQTLRDVENVPFIVYNFERPRDAHRYPNVCFKEPSIDEFLNDLASSRAVVSTAGFTLTSEALYLGKPLLVVPNRGIFEQTLNALFLERDGLGAAVLDRPLTVEDVTRFLDRGSDYEKNLEDRPSCGNEQALACIENILEKTGGSVRSSRRRSFEPVVTASPAVGSLD